jgi:RAB protein geranylgeranyltransferase component A
MDRNDYYGGESASLNLIQVLLFMICICQLLAVFLLLTTLVSDRF